MKLDKGTPPSAPDCEMFGDRFTPCRRLLHFVAVRILGSEHDGEKASGKTFRIEIESQPSESANRGQPSR
jgi:hypothetical protein